jgi:hypothetical protein
MLVAEASFATDEASELWRGLFLRPPPAIKKGRPDAGRPLAFRTKAACFILAEGAHTACFQCAEYVLISTEVVPLGYV